MKKTALVIMAAGIGSRFGNLPEDHRSPGMHKQPL